MNKRIAIAMALYALLALLVGLTLDNAIIYAAGRPVDLRVAVWLLLGGLAAKTLIAHKAGL